MVLRHIQKLVIKSGNNDHDLYLKCDVLLLLDVFDKFRNGRLKNHGLCHLSAPASSEDAMLSVKSLSLKLFQMQTFIRSLKNA